MSGVDQGMRDSFIESLPVTREFLLGLPVRGYAKFYKNRCLREAVARYKISDEEARLLYILAVMFMKNDDVIKLSSLAKDLKLSTKEQMHILEISRGLIERKLIESPNRRRGVDPINPCLPVNDRVVSFILFGREDAGISDGDNLYEVLAAARKIYTGHDADEDPPLLFHQEMRRLIEHISPVNPLYPYIKRACDHEAIVFLLAAERKLDGNDTVSMQDVLKALYGNELANRARFMKRIVKKELVLLKEKVLVLDERIKSTFRSTTSILLSDSVARKLFFNEESEEEMDEKRRYFSSSILEFRAAESFHEKIFLDGRLADEIDTITQAISPTGFERIGGELKKLKMPQGITILFHGTSGTGKTASVYELAKRCDRDVVQVSISQIRDMWVGESEKNTKRIFSEYARAREELPVEPILLLNEADALLNRRMSTSRSVDMMNNAMQNILLEELERFQGILFATTNLIENMDDAFSRRFLYKLEFPKPSEIVRRKIWKKKLPGMDTAMLAALSEFEFSGGQIDNIARRVLIGNLFKPHNGLTEVLELCKEELGFKWKNNKSRVGFRETLLNKEPAK